MPLTSIRRLTSRWLRPRSRRSILPTSALCLERLESRDLLDADPLNVGQFLQFRLDQPQVNDWIVVTPGQVYETDKTVFVGFQVPFAGPFTTMLAIENGAGNRTRIDTLAGTFTINATSSNHNVLAYAPNGAPLAIETIFAFQGDYLVTADTLVSQGMTPGGNVLVPGGGGSVQVDEMGSVLEPTSVQLRHQGGASSGPPEVVLHGSMGLGASSKFNALKKLMDKLHIDITDSADYYVSGDSNGRVAVLSRSGQGLAVNITPGQTFDLGGFASVTVDQATFAWDRQNQLLSIGGRFHATLNDDDASANPVPFHFSLGSSAQPGLVIDYAPVQTPEGAPILRKLLGEFARSNDPNTGRQNVTTAGAKIDLQSLMLVYDATLRDRTGRPYDAIGIGGEVDFTWGPASAGQSLKILLGDVNNDKAGLFFSDGRLVNFDAEIVGDFKIKSTSIETAQTDVKVTYVAGGETTPAVITVAGTLTASVDGHSMTWRTLPNAPIRYSNGDWTGSIDMVLSGPFGIGGGFDLIADNLSIAYERAANGHDIWTVSGGAHLPKLWNATLSFNDGPNPGLKIDNGSWALDGIQFIIDGITLGGAVGLKGLLIDFKRNGNDWDLTLSGKVILPGGIELDASFELMDGHPTELGVVYAARGADPGIPVGDTGLFLTEAGFTIDQLDSAEITVSGLVGLGYGDLDGERLFTINGDFKVDRHEFILQGDFKALQGILGQGTASVHLDWTQHEYKIQFDLQLYDGVFEITGEMDVNLFNQVAVYVDAGLRVPHFVPIIGGWHLADLEGFLSVDPVRPDNDLVAAWIDINLLFTHLRAGLEYRFHGLDKGLHFIHGKQIQKIEAQAQRNGQEYVTTYDSTSNPALVVDPAANQALFTFDWTGYNRVGLVRFTIPGVATPVELRPGVNDAQEITVNGVTYQVQPVADLHQSNRFAWILATDRTRNPNPYEHLPAGNYKVEIVTAEMATGRLTHSEAFAPPMVHTVSVNQPARSNAVRVTVGYGTGDPANTTIELYYSPNPTGGSGTRFATIVLSASDPLTGSKTTTWDLSGLPVGARYYVFARIVNGASQNSPNAVRFAPGTRFVSPTAVTVYATLAARLQLLPTGLPVDSAPDTLQGWQVRWDRTDVPGQTPQYTSTDTSGYTAVSVREGTWTVTVSPVNPDGFRPRPGAGQTATPNGQLVQAGVRPGSPAQPVQLNAAFNNTISVHGQVALDLTGLARYQPGAGVAGQVVYVDLNQNHQRDANEPFTTTNLGGYYDLRLLAPPVSPTTYTIRLAPAPGVTATFVHADPDHPTTTLTAGDSYAISVDVSVPNPREVFANRDFLVREPFVISGVAYVSGSAGVSLGAGAVPAAGVTIHVQLEDGSQRQSTVTAADGSYAFVLPSAGRYLVYTDEQRPTQVNVPARHQFTVGASTRLNNIGQNFYGYDFGDEPYPYAPWAVSGDFFGDGHASIATLAVDQQPEFPDLFNGNLYLLLFRGADSPGAVTTQAVNLGRINPFNDFGDVPGLFTCHQDLVLLITAGTLYGTGPDTMRWYNPKTGGFGQPVQPNDQTRPLFLATAHSTTETVFLMTDPYGFAWSLVTYTDLTDLTAAPRELAAFDSYPDFNVVRPYPTNGVQAPSRFGTLTTGDFDGDSVSDYAFGGIDGTGSQVVVYLLSRERDASGRFTRYHTLPLGGWQHGESVTAPYTLTSVTAVHLGGSPVDQLLVHRSLNGSSDVLILHANPAPGSGPVTDGMASAYFSFSSSLPVTLPVSNDFLADVNADGRNDLVLVSMHLEGSQGVNVLINEGNGRLSDAVSFAVGSGGESGAIGLISVSANPVPGWPVTVPSFLTWSPQNNPMQFNTLVTNATVFSNSYWAEIASPGSYGGYHFGFINPTSSGRAISGVASIDANANGRQDPGERNLINQRIAITLTDATGAVTQQSLTTDAAGRWSFAGTGWVSAVVTAPGLAPRNTQPVGAASYTLDRSRAGQVGFGFGVNYSTSDFGAIQGNVSVDNDGNGQWSPGDAPYAGLMLYVDGNGNGKLDVSDPTATTDAQGNYRFAGLRPGNYVVRQVLPAGVTQVWSTQPASGVPVEAGQTHAAINFGNRTRQLRPDFNFDNHTDLVRLIPLEDGTTQVQVDYLIGNRLARAQIVAAYNPQEWRPVGVGDFNGDSHADLLFERLADGSLSSWQLRQGERVRVEPLTALPTGWRIAGMADLDHQGTTDLLLRHERSGQLVAWLMDGGARTRTTRLGRLERHQTLEGVADLNGDGWVDLVVRDTQNGDVHARFLRDGEVLGTARVGQLDAAFRLVGASSWGQAIPLGTDLFWQHEESGEVARWGVDFLNGLIDVIEGFDLGGTGRPGRYLHSRR